MVAMPNSIFQFLLHFTIISLIGSLFIFYCCYSFAVHNVLFFVEGVFGEFEHVQYHTQNKETLSKVISNERQQVTNYHVLRINCPLHLHV